MNIVAIENRDDLLTERLVTVWESAVKATHLFLSEEEIKNIKTYVPQALKEVENLIVAENENNIPVAFMGICERKIEMLFVENSERGKGIGSALIKYSIENFNADEVAVNEQNPQAKGFYERMGFEVYKRSELNEQGNNYPILYMKR